MYMTGKDAPPSCALVLSEDLNVSVYCAHTDKKCQSYYLHCFILEHLVETSNCPETFPFIITPPPC